MNLVLPQTYFPISEYFFQKFGEKVYKISVSVSETCPNRMGIGGMEICVFCDVWGSAAYHMRRNLELREQIKIGREKIRQRYKVNQFLVYFQSYTNTFLRVRDLEQKMRLSLEEKDVVGLVIGTRPDCLPRAMLKIFDEISRERYLLLELGIQSFSERDLLFMKRGHTAKKNLEAIHKIAEQVPNAEIGVHLIFGCPEETETEILKSAELLNRLPVRNVKLHNLHVLKDTGLEKQYRAGTFQPIDLETYARHVGIFLSRLSPKIAVQRLAASANRWDELIAPDWTKNRLKTHQHILDSMKRNGFYQGRFY